MCWSVWVLWTDRAELAGEVEAPTEESALSRTRWVWAGLGAMPMYVGVHAVRRP